MERYSGGRSWLDPVRVMHAVRAAADGLGAVTGEHIPEVPAEDVLAALTQLDEARAALDTLERDLTRAARTRNASWQEIADALGLSSPSSAESRHVRLQRDAATYRADRYPRPPARRPSPHPGRHRLVPRQRVPPAQRGSGAWPRTTTPGRSSPAPPPPNNWPPGSETSTDPPLPHTCTGSSRCSEHTAQTCLPAPKPPAPRPPASATRS
jgi:hypothetical protein